MLRRSRRVQIFLLNTASRRLHLRCSTGEIENWSSRRGGAGESIINPLLGSRHPIGSPRRAIHDRGRQERPSRLHLQAACWVMFHLVTTIPQASSAWAISLGLHGQHRRRATVRPGTRSQHLVPLTTGATSCLLCLVQFFVCISLAADGPQRAIINIIMKKMCFYFGFGSGKRENVSKEVWECWTCIEIKTRRREQGRESNHRLAGDAGVGGVGNLARWGPSAVSNIQKNKNKVPILPSRVLGWSFIATNTFSYKKVWPHLYGPCESCRRFLTDGYKVIKHVRYCCFHRSAMF